MNVKKRTTILFALLLPAFIATAKSISLDNRNIHVSGAPYISRSSAKLTFKRFPEAVLAMPDSVSMFSATSANTTSGIAISFKVKSSKINLQFSAEPGLSEKGSFLVLRDGNVYRTVTFTAADAKKAVSLTLDSLPVDKVSVYEIVLPSYANFSLTGLDIDEKADLIDFKDSKKIYIGFGDSITHGWGQDGASYLTYPYLLSRKLNMELYNQAISGSKVSVTLAEKANELPAADVITILIGYNDLSGASHSTARFESDYRSYLSLIRKYQRKAKIFCITLLYTKKVQNDKTHFTPNDFRAVVKKVVGESQKTDKKLYLIEGDKITTAENLQPGDKTDPVHMTVKGAALFADALYKEMQKSL